MSFMWLMHRDGPAVLWNFVSSGKWGTAVHSNYYEDYI